VRGLKWHIYPERRKEAWIKMLEVFEQHMDVLEEAAERLFQDKVLDDKYWEKVLLR
jgi:hypothetical protein